jgi:hypothetical protein
MIDNLLTILTQLASNYKHKTPQIVKVYDFHVLLCLLGIFLCELYRSFLGTSFKYSYNICYMTCVASLALTRDLTSLSTPPPLRRSV